MADFEAFPSPHDPDTAQVWTKKFTLPLGRSFQLVTADVVDDADVQVPSPSLIVSGVAFASTNATTNEWSVSVTAAGGAAAIGTWVPIRYRYWLDGQDLSGPPLGDTTLLLEVQQT